MAVHVIVYNKPLKKLTTLSLIPNLNSVDLTEINLSLTTDLSNSLTDDTFALVFNGTDWQSLTYTQWETLRINEALQEVSNNFGSQTQGILSRFVDSMNIKYKGKKSWVELLDQLGKEIEVK
ncbi:hypothetical protein [Furfurilactobacillus curtus]|uniref:DUF1828 domain-containing protein n=1 Tax=Furfurilactobacillus curtus TaxID=1746200 RepID=A0ABQ5JM63_9LACO